MPRLFPILILAGALSAQAADNALLVVNGDSWASTYLANEYAAARQIPPSHIVVLRDLPSFEHLGVEDFRTRILTPALRTAEQRGLAPQLDYLLYSADFPIAIDVSADLAGKQLPKVITQPASLTGLTYLYAFTQKKTAEYLGLNANFYFRGRAPLAPQPPLPAEEQKTYREAMETLQKAGAAHAKDPKAAVDEASLRSTLPALLALKSAHPKNAEILYNLACVYSLLGDFEQAVGSLHDAIDAGWWDMMQAARDPDLHGVRDREDFKALAPLARKVKIELAPASGFRGLVGWQPGGRVTTPDQGMHYLLSTMLAYTSGQGNSVKEALAALKRSAGADGTHPGGTVYFLKNQDVRSVTREWGFEIAAQKLGEAHVSAKVEDGILPAGKADVMGAVIGAANFDWTKSGSTILPGAICEHLTSWGGALGDGEGAGQTPLTEFIRHGAAGSSGTVMEPYAIQSKFPTPLIHWYYAQGCTLAESFYQSVEGPYQLLIVGDALCAPWKKPLSVGLAGVKEGAVVKGLVAMRTKVEASEGLSATNVEIHLDGRRLAATAQDASFNFDTTHQPDGAHTLTLVANGNDPLGTRAEHSVHIVIQNQTESISAKASASEIPWDQELTVTGSAKGASEIILRHWSGEVARISGAEGSAKIDSRRLGQGPSIIQPVAVFEGGREVMGEPIAVRVIPPAALPAHEPGGALEPGFVVTPEGGTPAVVQEAKGDWLAGAGVKPDTTFTVEGVFNVPEDDVYQFQLHGATDLKMEVDGRAQTWPAGKEWFFLPVHLAPGTHRMRLTAKSAGPFEARFGGPGARHLTGVKFQHQK